MAKSKLLGDDFFRMRPMPGGDWYVAADRRRERSPHGRPGRAIIDMIFNAPTTGKTARGKVVGIPAAPRPPLPTSPTPEPRKRAPVKNFLSHYLDPSPKVGEHRFQPI